MPERLLVDACFLTSLIRSTDANHDRATAFYHQHLGATWVVATLAYFEFQAAQSRSGHTYREMYVSNLEVFELTLEFARRCAQQQVFNKFLKLRGADLVYACIAKVEGIPLVTFDKAFDFYRGEIQLHLLI
jgi:predicted nucleic acid-binding protein